MKKHIFLIGFMGTGKSSTSLELAGMLDVRQIEMDDEIVRENGMSISDMFECYGEEYFRDKETDLLRRIAGMEPAIISCGGGCVLRPENVALMKNCGTIILLTGEPETIYERVHRSQSRPILNGHMNVEYIAELMEKRRPAYEAAADLAVPSDGKTPGEVAREIIKLF
ncbi:MAG: shikimate kinase [Clostridiales bacterium]|nr:shikimate kinase [Clostridiales bacterium]